jgi:Polysaccharide deacetylase
MDLKIGIAGISPGWKIILEQEGIGFKEIDCSLPIDQDEYSAIIIDDINIATFDRSYLNNGGAILFSSKSYAKIFHKKRYILKWKKHVAERNSIFSELGIIDLAGEIGIIKDKELKCEDKGLNIFSGKLGKGSFFILPFDLDEEILNLSSCRRKFIANRNEQPSEVVAKVSKAKLRKAVKIILSNLIDIRKLPFINKSYIPGDNGLFIFRIDTDNCSIEEAKELLTVCEKHSIKASWFVDTQNEQKLINFYSKMKDQEIGLHCFRHLVFDNYSANYENIDAGMKNLQRSNINVKGFAAPFGSWNTSLNESLEKFDLTYSSEFVPSYDDLPFNIYSQNQCSNILQIPIHPISLGRLRRSHFTEEEMIDYYKNIINEKLRSNEPIIIYHHPHHKLLDVIDAVFGYVNKLGLANITMKEYAVWWQRRNHIKIDISFEDNELRMDVDDVDMTVISNNKICNFKSKAKVDLSKLAFINKKSLLRSKKMLLTRKYHWRDTLYEYESWKGRRNR